ncbi:MAG: hypothetical protein ACI8YQ_003004 [Polaribacter sp.]|jgi:hypothetical protein
MPIENSVAALLANVNKQIEEGYPRNLDTLRVFLESQDNAIIRIFIADSSGYGHQSNTANIMRRLIALGFRQQYYIVYQPGDDNGNFIKLQRLFPGLTADNQGNFDLVTTAETANCNFVSSVTFLAADPAPAMTSIGFTGGWDTNPTNLATTYRSHYFLKLQPYQWDEPKKIAIQTKLSTIAQFEEAEQVNLDAIEALGHFSGRAYYMPTPIPAIEGNFTGASAAKWAPYQAILAASAASQVNMMPVYGIGDLFGVIEAMAGVRPETLLYNLIAGIALAQTEGAASLRRSAVLTIIATVTPKAWTNLQTLIDGEFNEKAALNKFSTDTLDLAACVTIIDYGAANFDATLLAATQNPNRIVLVKFNGLPQPAFDYIYSQATLPSLFEGKGTANLALNINNPFLWIRDSAKPLYPTLPLGAQAEFIAGDMSAIAKTLNDTPQQTNANLINGGVSWENSAPMQLSFALNLLANPQQGLSQYFSSLFEFFHNPEEDKLFQGTFYLVNFINAQNQ